MKFVNSREIKMTQNNYDGITHFEGCHDPKDPQHMGCKPNAYKTAEDIAIEILASLEGPTQRQGMMAYIAQALRDFAAWELERVRDMLLSSDQYNTWHGPDGIHESIKKLREGK